MAEVQTNTESGEMTQRFIEFVMMQAQQAMLFLGQIPHPQTGKPEVNLDIAKMFIDQLVMIREKTRGNLNNDESGVLNNAVSSLQMAFVEITRQHGGEKTAPASPEPAPELKPEAAAGQAAAPAQEGPGSAASEESKKKFSKSYGS
ncbi:MAG TPA: DUF1844 domain-containing protein [Chthoniobacteraceae bacterium]|nr:DUF1844 domain-containing protein [Chthoniobacteraceae bacterium]